MHFEQAFVGFKTGSRQGAVSATSPQRAESEPHHRRQPVFTPTLTGRVAFDDSLRNSLDRCS